MELHFARKRQRNTYILLYTLLTQLTRRRIPRDSRSVPRHTDGVHSDRHLLASREDEEHQRPCINPPLLYSYNGGKALATGQRRSLNQVQCSEWRGNQVARPSLSQPRFDQPLLCFSDTAARMRRVILILHTSKAYIEVMNTISMRGCLVIFRFVRGSKPEARLQSQCARGLIRSTTKRMNEPSQPQACRSSPESAISMLHLDKCLL